MSLQRWLQADPARTRELVVCVAATLVALLPFVNKAFHIDGTMYLWAAQHIVENPVDFYGFDVHWLDTYMPMSHHNQNPPLISYYLAIAGTLTGWSEWGIHLLLILPAAGAIAGVYFIAKTMMPGRAAVAAALAVLVSPGFWISATNAMADILMLCFYVWAVALWMRGTEGELDDAKSDRLLYAAVLIGLGFLTKYFAISLVPLLALYALVAKRNAMRWWKVFLIPIAVVVVYELTTKSLYGKGMFLGASQAAARTRAGSDAAWLDTTLSGLAFLGGTALPLLFLIPLLWSRKLWALWPALAGVLVWVLSRQATFGSVDVQSDAGTDWLLAAQGGVLATTGIMALVFPAAQLIRHRTRETLLLVIWIYGTFYFAAYLNWSITVRTMIPLLPPLMILAMQRIADMTPDGETAFDRPAPRAALALAALAGLSLTWTDFAWANSQREAARRYANIFEDYPGTIRFAGHWGWQWYMEERGAKPRDMRDDRAEIGDVVIVPRNNVYGDAPPDAAVIAVHTSRLEPGFGAATMSHPAGAGFYSSVWGPIPFTFGGIVPETYNLYVIGPQGGTLPFPFPSDPWLGPAIDPAGHDAP